MLAAEGGKIEKEKDKKKKKKKERGVLLQFLAQLSSVGCGGAVGGGSGPTCASTWLWC
jgi:hypothetical protein